MEDYAMNRKKIAEKLKKLSGKNVIKEQIINEENKDKHKTDFETLERIVEAGRDAIKGGKSFSNTKSDMIKAFDEVLGNEEQKPEIEEAKPVEKTEHKPFQHKGESIYVETAHRPVA